MAQQGFDSAFGLKGSCASHVSGFGGWPMGVVIGVDGRPTLICSAPDQKAGDQGVSPGGRFRGRPVTTLRIVSFPSNGRPVGSGSNGIVVSVDPAAGEPIYPERAIMRPDRIAVLGSVIRANRAVPTLWVFAAGVVQYGIANWTLERRIEFAHLAGFEGRCGLGWGDDGDVLVVAPELAWMPPRRGRPPEPARWVLRLVVDSVQHRQRTANVTIRPGLDLPNGFGITPRVSAVCTDRGDGLLVGLTYEGVDPQGGHRPIGWLDAARASVLKLRRSDPDPVGPLAGSLEPDPGFGQEGVWVVTAADGEITTVDRMDLREPTALVVAGRARRAGTWSLYAASLDPAAGAIAWSAYPGQGVLGEPTGLAVEGGRILLCGATLKLDPNRPVDPAEGIVVCLSAGDGQPVAGFGTGGVARYRLNGATYATALAVTAAGESLVASILRWGWSASAATFHACISRLTAGGSLDGSFGLAGVFRHNGLGAASRVAVNQAGRVWSAGVTQIFRGMVPGYWPWSPQKPDFFWVLSVSQLTAEGELDGTFGEGIRTHQLGMLLPVGETEFDLASLVPLAAGGAILAGPYFKRVLVNTTTGETDQEFRGSWIARLTSTGTLDPAFGTNGLRTYPLRAIELVRELANGSLQGYDSSVPLRLAGNGDSAPGFGPNGIKPIAPKSPITMPLNVEPDGEWFALVWGPRNSTSMRWTIGLVRCPPDGVVDRNFGAGAATPPNGCFVDVTSVQRPTVLLDDPNWNDQAGPYQTLRLGDGTLLTIWSLSWQENVNQLSGPPKTWRPWGIALVAWTAQGLPRAVTQWGGKPAKAIRNPVSVSFAHWFGWRNECALLQPDGSILIGLAGDDVDEARVNPTSPRPLRQSAYFCRLLPPGFDLDPGFGAAGILVRRLSNDGYRTFPPGDPRNAGNQVDSQVPEGLSLVGSNTVMAAVACRAVYESGLSQGGLSDRVAGSPDLPFDGSVGVARLI